MSDYLIKEETLNNLANSVRAVSGESAEMTPDQMVMTMNNTKSAMDALDEHINDKNNPHDITAEQVGAAKTDLSNVPESVLENLGGLKAAYGSYTGDGTLTKTITHNLGKVPVFAAVSSLTSTSTFVTWMPDFPATGNRVYTATDTTFTMKGIQTGTDSAATGAGYCFNQSGSGYKWLIIG